MDDETRQVIADAVAEATGGLAKKNADLLKELKEAKQKAGTLDEVDLDGLKAQAKELADLKQKKLEDDGEYKKMYDASKSSHQNELDKLIAEKNAIAEKLTFTNKKNALTSELIASNAVPELVVSAVALLGDRVELDPENKPIVDGKPLSDFVQDWAKTDVGKHFIKFDNSGGGAGGSEGGGVNANAKFFDKKNPEYSLTEQGKIANVDPEGYKKLKNQYK